MVKWFNTKKDYLKNILTKHFKKGSEYTEIKIIKKRDGNESIYYETKITPNCFKELCMILQTAKAKEARKFFIEIEKFVKKYYEHIQSEMYKEIGINQKLIKGKSKSKEIKKPAKTKSKTIKKVTKATKSKSKSKSSKKTVKSTRAKKIKSKSKSK